MDKKSKILIKIFLIITGVSIMVTFHKYIILEDINFYTDEQAFSEALTEE